MKVDAVFSFDNTFEVWEPIVSQDPVSGQAVTTYELLVADRGLILPVAGGTVVLASRTAYPLRAKIRFAKDKNGTAIFAANGQEYDMYVNDCVAQYDGFGSVVGWRHTIHRTIRRTAEEMGNSIIGGLS